MMTFNLPYDRKDEASPGPSAWERLLRSSGVPRVGALLLLQAKRERET